MSWPMADSSDDYFVEISLDSVLSKATGLENSLRACRSRAEATDEGYKSIIHSYQHCPLPKRRGAKLPTTTTTTTTTLPTTTTTTGLSDHWERLTAYIMSLEKEVQYYKQLSQDMQANNHMSRDIQTDQRDIQLSQDVANLNGRGIESSTDQITFPFQNRTKQRDPKLLPNKDPESHALLLIFSYLSLEALSCASLVCRQWYSVTRHPSLWKRIVISETVIDPQVLFTMSRWCVSTQVLVLHGLMPPTASCDEDLQSYINKTRGSLEPGLTSLMQASGPTLTCLTVTECNLMATERIFWLASVHCPNLTSFTYWSDEFPPSSESLWSLANGCPHLEHLSLPPTLESPNAHWFNDSCLFVIAHAWPHLLSLTVGGSSITPEGLKEIAHKCPQLYYLEIIHGPSLHKEAMEKLCLDGGFQSLSRLILNFTPSSYIALKLLIENCGSLKSLELHVAMRCYFTDRKTDTVANYRKIIFNIKKLQNHSRGRKMFHLIEH